MEFVAPKVRMLGYTCLDWQELERYLQETGNYTFLEDARLARDAGYSDGEIMCSFMAKLCYASLSVGHNDNISKVRSIPDNLAATYAAAHGSVFEHCTLNFVAYDVSRVFTHELVRHRVGTAFSQTSGRYVRSLPLRFVADPILEPYTDAISQLLQQVEEGYARLCDAALLPSMDMDTKKRLTSALRRVLPNGQANEVGFSVNLRELRHMVMMRTARTAEWEIRTVFAEVYELVRQRYPSLFKGAVVEFVRGVLEVSGLRLQPYEVQR